MATRGRATIEDLRRVPGKAELVGGELVPMSAAGGRHGYATMQIAASLLEHVRRTGHGYAFGDNVGFRVDLPNRQSFSPDAAFHLGQLSADFVEGAPLFAVEVRSKDDYGPAAEALMAAKRADYFRAGTVVVWDVDTEREGWVRVYRTGTSATFTEYRRGERAEAEPALPGWSLPVDDLFPPEH